MPALNPYYISVSTPFRFYETSTTFRNKDICSKILQKGKMKKPCFTSCWLSFVITLLALSVVSFGKDENSIFQEKTKTPRLQKPNRMIPGFPKV